MANEIVQQEHVCVIQVDYYYRMVNVRKRIHREAHRETKLKENNLFLFY